jgi:hypothetical protein
MGATSDADDATGPRHAVLSAVEAKPGTTHDAIMEDTGYAWGTVGYELVQLVRDGSVRVVNPADEDLHWFAAGVAPDGSIGAAEWDAKADALRNRGSDDDEEPGRDPGVGVLDLNITL